MSGVGVPQPADSRRISFADADSVRELLGLMVGAASVCWDEAGVFQDQDAQRIVEAGHDRLIELGWAS